MEPETLSIPLNQSESTTDPILSNENWLKIERLVDHTLDNGCEPAHIFPSSATSKTPELITPRHYSRQIITRLIQDHTEGVERHFLTQAGFTPFQWTTKYRCHMTMTDSLFLLKDFDESTYLKLNPDVSAAVDKKSFRTGLEHCLTHGIYENRPGLPQAIKDHMSSRGDALAPPPSNLRARVHGDENLPDFIKVGKLLSYNLFSSLLSIAEKTSGNRVLDFGCGCGRVINYLSNLFIDNQFYGSDIDQEAITWCRNNLSNIAKFTTNNALPPLQFDDNYFDIVYSISVFTHLPEEMQFLWLEELKRVTRKGGYLLTTTHGVGLAPDELQQHLSNHGFYYAVAAGTDGLPDFYQTSFHSEQYIRHHWSDYFEIVRIINKGIQNHQDLVICRKTA
jgi:SAM-dependent methyltransferase